MSEEQIIHQFKKNANETVMVKFSEFKGKRLIDLRVFYLSEDGIWRPTPKGISLRRELIPELKQGIDKAAEEYEKELSGLEEKGRDYGQTGEKGLGAYINGGGHGPNQDAKARTYREGQGEGSANE